MATMADLHLGPPAWHRCAPGADLLPCAGVPRTVAPVCCELSLESGHVTAPPHTRRGSPPKPLA